jgi:hypothetical protein
LGVVGFLIAVKRLAILPAPLHEWHDMASYFRFRRPYIRWTGYFNFGYFGDDETEGGEFPSTAGNYGETHNH